MSMQVRPEIPSLSRIEWQFFVTLSLLDERVTDDWAIKHWFTLARNMAKWFRVHFLELRWCLRSEFGELTGRKHLHALVAGLPNDTMHVHTCFAIKNEAERIGFGMSRCYVFNPRLEGVDYLLKQMETVDWMHSNGASIYEFSKFRPGVVMLAKSVLREIDRRCLRGQTQPFDTVQKPVSDPMMTQAVKKFRDQAKTRSLPCSTVRSGGVLSTAVKDSR